MLLPFFMMSYYQRIAVQRCSANAKQAKSEMDTNGMATPSASSFSPLDSDESPPSPPPVSSLLTPRFHAIASRAYQEAVKLPENPPPVGWSPGDPLHSYYEARLYKFRDLFRETLERQGDTLPTNEPRAFRAEWLAHSRSIMANVRAEWDMYPLSSMGGWKSDADTPHRIAAVFALRCVVEPPVGPPPEDWDWSVRRGTARLEDLHIYYQIMLSRFDGHMEQVLREYGARLGMSREEICQATTEYIGLIIRENRVTWMEMFPSN